MTSSRGCSLARSRIELRRLDGSPVGPLALPLVVSAQARLVFFHLHLKLAEGLLARGAQVFAVAGGVERASGQGKSQRKGMLFVARVLGKNAVQLDEVGLIGLQKPLEFLERPRNVGLGGVVRLYVSVADRELHECTYRTAFGRE